jgi:murein DD-endopeptidase MepM/ murein hydrolase activator NlpD
MKTNKKLLSLVLCLAVLGFASAAKEITQAGTNYALRFVYNDTAAPGDPVFVRLTVTDTGNRPNPKLTASTARLVLTENNSAGFYPLPGRGQAKSQELPNSLDLLAGIPLSTWQKTGEYTLTVSCAPFGGKALEYQLPLTVVPKEFDSETLRMGESNTAIMHDESPERVAQSDKLNKIVLTRNKDGVYQQSPFAKPVSSTRMTSLFGDRRVYVYTNGKSSTSEHYGNDFGVPRGTPVRACAAGRVVLAELRILTGWSVIIEHLPGLYSLYYHMDSLSVKENDLVKQGGAIGNSGSTGFATGPHLHWEMRLNAVAVNPDFFTQDFAFWEE